MGKNFDAFCWGHWVQMGAHLLVLVGTSGDRLLSWEPGSSLYSGFGGAGENLRLHRDVPRARLEILIIT